MKAQKFSDFQEWMSATADAADLPLETVKRIINKMMTGSDPISYIEYGEGYWDFDANVGAVYTE